MAAAVTAARTLRLATQQRSTRGMEKFGIGEEREPRREKACERICDETTKEEVEVGGGTRVEIPFSTSALHSFFPMVETNQHDDNQNISIDGQ